VKQKLKHVLTLTEAMNLTAEAFHMKKAQVFDLCKNSKDEAFHYLLYQVGC
jgi:hypothetical protein